MVLEAKAVTVGEAVAGVVAVAGLVAEEEGSSSCMSHRSWNRNYGHILPTPPIHKYDHTPSCSRYLR